MEEDKMIDQSGLANDVASKIPYEFTDYFLVKPLDPIKVKKEFKKPVSTGTPTEDANGIIAEDFDNVETEVIEVDSDYRKAVIIKRPASYEAQLKDIVENNFKDTLVRYRVGDVIIIRESSGLRFDLLKDSRLVKYYDILGVER